MIQNIVVNKALMTAAQELVSNFCQNCDTATIADIEVYMQKYIRADMFANIASLFLAASLVCLVGKRKPHSKSLEKAKSIVRSMLLRASVDANAQNEDLINSVAVGLEHATLFKTDLVLPMLAEQVAKSIHIKSGELVVLRYVFKPFASDHTTIFPCCTSTLCTPGNFTQLQPVERRDKLIKQNRTIRICGVPVSYANGDNTQCD